MLDFPSSPVDGQTYSGYVFSNGVWLQSGTLVNTGSPFKRTTFNASSSTFQYDSTTLYADVEVQGGGGSGGGVNAGAAGAGGAAPGGGAGGYVKKLIQVDATVRAATKTITVGAGGSPGSTSQYNDGTNNLIAGGGSHGVGGTPIAQIPVFLGGPGGTASGGDINIPGQPGVAGVGYGASATGAASTAAACSGAGGSSPFGVGGRGWVITYTSTATSAVGSIGQGYGSGGGGSVVANAGSSAGGGAGANGVVVITEYR